jgi:ectoine hydroxylase-related dioxygenase (phytanoyl-CoA dioxygenase family)
MDNSYRIIKNAFSTELLDKVNKDFENVALCFGDSDVFKTKNGDVKQIQNCQVLDVFKEIANHIKNVLGFDGEVMNMQYFIKHPNYKITAPHQDGAYFDDVDSDIYTFWIPLHSVNVDTSTMFYYDWNGVREITPHENVGTNVRSRTGKVGYSQYTSIHPMDEFKPVILDYGDCVVHNQFSVHYSNENSTDKPRIAITCILKINNKK